jgi:hypothetical protein
MKLARLNFSRMQLDRRRFIKALGLGALAHGTTRTSAAFAAEVTPPSRIVFFVQPHAHVPVAWNMPIPGGPTDRVAERSLLDVGAEEFGEALRPLHGFRDRLLLVEGLAHTSVLADIAQIRQTGGNDNNHQVAVAGLLTGVRASQTAGVVGGGRSLDQELAMRTGGPGRFGSRVYGSEYLPNNTVSPFSLLGPAQATPMVNDPAAAFADLLGYVTAAPAAGAGSRENLLRTMRPSVLDAVAAEYEALGKQLGRAGRLELEQHWTLLRELETSVGGDVPVRAACDAAFNGSGDKVSQFMRLIRMAFACDLTRVATFVAPVPQAPEFGYPADANVHANYAHASVANHLTCGQMFSPFAERAMIDLGSWYARHFALLLTELDSVAEGSGTLLDHTVVVWTNELGTPTHAHEDVFTLLAGGCNGFFRTGRHVRYPRDLPNPLAGQPRLGPGHNRLLVSLMQAMGQTDTSFGMTEALGADGTTIGLTGPLTELHRV